MWASNSQRSNAGGETTGIRTNGVENESAVGGLAAATKRASPASGEGRTSCAEIGCLVPRLEAAHAASSSSAMISTEPRDGVGGLLRQQRQAAGLTRQALAEKAKCSIASVALFEGGYAPERSAVLPRLFAALKDLPMDDDAESGTDSPRVTTSSLQAARDAQV
jgi:hypothetical protein